MRIARDVFSIWIVAISMVVVLLNACGGHGTHGTGHAAHEPHQAPGRHDPGIQPIELDVVLNGTDKWVMDDHTRLVFGIMMDRFVGRDLESSSAKDLSALGTQMQGDIGDLIKGCTMTGAAHNELHKFLGRYLPAVNKMTTSGEAARAGQVRLLLELYLDYFE